MKIDKKTNQKKMEKNNLNIYYGIIFLLVLLN
jgi:hypothetical protein